MTATLEEIKQWAKDAKAEGATHMIVMCDTYDYSNYPVSVMPGQNAYDLAVSKSTEMQKVDECYNLKLDLQPQLEFNRTLDYRQLIDEINTDHDKDLIKD